MEPTVKHVFVCTNQRRTPISCGLRINSADFAEKLKRGTKLIDGSRESGSQPSTTVHVAKTKCLGRCPQGPVIAVYPDKVWYTYSNDQDIDEIVDALAHGGIVPRLQLNSWETRPVDEGGDRSCR